MRYFIMILFVFLLTACGDNEQNSSSSQESVTSTGIVHEITVIGYTGNTAEDFKFEPAEVAVKKGDTVKITLESDNTVEHGFTLNTLRQSVKQGETVEFIANKTGQHVSQCTVFCGAGHGVMTFTLTVE